MSKAITSISATRKKELYEKIKPIAQDARNRIIDKNSIIENPFYTLEQAGFFIVGFPSKDDRISGFHIQKSEIHFIYVNTGHDLGRQYFSSFHEYYHIFTGEESDGNIIEKREHNEIEYKAECFAGCILMPENLVKKYIMDHAINLNWLSHAQLIKMFTYFNVSYNAMLKRLTQLYPGYLNMNKLYGISTKPKRKEFIQKIKDNDGNEKLIHPTSNLYITQSFFEDLKFNIENERISQDKAKGIITMLNSVAGSID